MIKTVVFDMDGVIFDSERVAYDYFVTESKKRGFEDAEKPYIMTIGANHAKCVQIYEEYYNGKFPYAEVWKGFREFYQREYGNVSLPMKKGVFEILSYLKEKGCYIALASSTGTERVKMNLTNAGIIDYFDRLVCGDMITHSKPDPEIFLKAVEGVEEDMSRVVVIEDSYNGIKAADAAGMIAVMVPDMLEADEEMQQKADYIVDDLLQVIDLLEKL